MARGGGSGPHQPGRRVHPPTRACASQPAPQPAPQPQPQPQALRAVCGVRRRPPARSRPQPAEQGPALRRRRLPPAPAGTHSLPLPRQPLPDCVYCSASYAAHLHAHMLTHARTPPALTPPPAPPRAAPTCMRSTSFSSDTGLPSEANSLLSSVAPAWGGGDGREGEGEGKEKAAGGRGGRRQGCGEGAPQQVVWARGEHICGAPAAASPQQVPLFIWGLE